MTRGPEGERGFALLLVLWTLVLLSLIVTGMVSAGRVEAQLASNLRAAAVAEAAADGAVHQGLALSVPAFDYLHPDDLLEEARQRAHLQKVEPLLVALDGVTDPRNLGAVLRSVAAFGAHGVLLPLRRSVGVTPVVGVTGAVPRAMRSKRVRS